ncbi:MAG TPA: hypothetical protein DEB30_01410 [Candidatus Peribacter riflensis]|nr:MAG: hypothetical protein A2398_01410 [Candidatus Peribacteria bacterium RIFOXYB1_FULL_57_12]OGJ79760.1 MAG: hypothetical protein A2412_02865 [Candidatus Peribacteria bacterium RIFOXYC1_FULL_58_8]HBH19445.1 hypothetical protein [Candidatus Peribacter riflensis]HBU09443.1 hypothetical protein [Candidatus Peribacter riflensis]
MSSEVITNETSAERGAQIANAIALTQWSDAAFGQSLLAVTEAAQGHAEEQYIRSLVSTLQSLYQQICSTAFFHAEKAVRWSGADHQNEHARFVEPLGTLCSNIHVQIGRVYEKLSDLFRGNEDGFFAVECALKCIHAAEEDQRRYATAVQRDIGNIEPVAVIDPSMLKHLSKDRRIPSSATDGGSGPEDTTPGDLGPEWSV